MKNIWTKIATLMLALLMAISCFAFVACSNDTPKNPDDPDTDPVDPGTDPGTEPEEDPDAPVDYIMSIPKQNFGKSFTFLTTDNERAPEIYIETEDDAVGDTVQTAIFYRNNRVEEHLGVDLSMVIGPGGGWNNFGEYLSFIQQSYQTGDQDFQLISLYEARAAEVAIAGLTYDVNSIDAIDLSSPWYVQSWLENSLINDRIYMVLSDLSYTMWRYINAMYFNKQLSDELGISEQLYDIAREGDLTLEYIMSCAELVAEETGNDTWDEYDKYGICFSPFNCRAFVTFFDIPVITPTDDGEFEIVLYTERLEDVYATMQNYMFNYDFVYMNNKDPNDHNNTSVTGAMFMEDRLLFFPAYLETSQMLRAMEGSFGILPLPKYDDTQEDYKSHSNDGFTVFSIPAHAEDAEFCGIVLDALSAENKFSVIPAFYDVVLKGRTTKDEQSGEMLDQIRDHLHFDFAFVHLSALDTMWTKFGGTVVWQDNTSFKSYYDTNESTWKGLLNDVIDAYWDIR